MHKNVYGWGAVGHRLVARLARSQLTSEASDWVKYLVPWYLSGNLTAVTISANDILYPDTNSFAFPNWQRVIDTNLDDVQHQEALMFLVHFVGDIHQPLHVGVDTDRGGNSVRGNISLVNFRGTF
ncbi:unnamed protein product [Rotaria magnacalcarata]|uniref:Uncharacterized protein n=1 Tax=Rotaria magnacalcarata TaxID=392030 RepID=A0A820SJA4_9BILA|nr:unnamed protein product [Rotaria magnacalcarata]